MERMMECLDNTHFLRQESTILVGSRESSSIEWRMLEGTREDTSRQMSNMLDDPNSAYI